MRNQGNEFIRDVFELGPPMLVDSATMKAMKISRFERVRINSVADSAPIILIASFKVLLIKLYHIPPPPRLQHLHNSAAFKARTKARSKFRDKRVDVGEF